MSAKYNKLLKNIKIFKLFGNLYEYVENISKRL